MYTLFRSIPSGGVFYSIQESLYQSRKVRPLTIFLHLYHPSIWLVSCLQQLIMFQIFKSVLFVVVNFLLLAFLMCSLVRFLHTPLIAALFGFTLSLMCKYHIHVLLNVYLIVLVRKLLKHDLLCMVLHRKTVFMQSVDILTNLFMFLFNIY